MFLSVDYIILCTISRKYTIFYISAGILYDVILLA